jgi:hypothetical protein
MLHREVNEKSTNTGNNNPFAKLFTGYFSMEPFNENFTLPGRLAL